MVTYTVEDMSYPEILLSYIRRFDPNAGGIYYEGNVVSVENNTVDLTSPLANWMALSGCPASIEATEDIDYSINFPFADFIVIVYENNLPMPQQVITGNELILNFQDTGTYHVEIIKGLESFVILAEVA